MTSHQASSFLAPHTHTAQQLTRVPRAAWLPEPLPRDMLLAGPSWQGTRLQQGGGDKAEALGKDSREGHRPLSLLGAAVSLVSSSTQSAGTSL